MEKKEMSETIIALSKNAMEAWLKGNPTPYLKLYSKDFTYFDPSTDFRLDGWDKIEELYESMRGKVYVERFEIINPKVQLNGNMAVLSFNLHMFAGDMVWKENCTEVYLFTEEKEWKIIHSHFSPTKPSLK